MLMACSGVGAFFGASTIAYMRHIKQRGRFVVRAGMGCCAMIFCFTFSRSFYLSGALLALVGYCMVLMVATISASLQHLTDDHMRGRVMSIYSTAFLGLPPIGCLIAASLTRIFTASHAIAGMQVAGMGALLCVFATRRGLRELE